MPTATTHAAIAPAAPNAAGGIVRHGIGCAAGVRPRAPIDDAAASSVNTAMEGASESQPALPSTMPQPTIAANAMTIARIARSIAVEDGNARRSMARDANPTSTRSSQNHAYAAGS
jgi:hypothetical protein